MSSKHSAEFKAKVALEAVSEENKIYSAIATKYDISSDEVSVWVSELKSNAATVFGGSSTGAHASTSTVEDISIESDNAIFIEAVSHGVENENLDYGKLFFWSGLGIAIVVVLIVGLIFFSQFAFSNAQNNASNSSTYLEITKLNADQTEQLNSFGVVDLEAGVYRIPIEEAINKVAID